MTITASIIGASFLTVMMDGTTHTINSDHANYTAVREALRTKDHESVERLINMARAVENYVAGKITVRGDQVFYGEQEIKNSVVTRILAMLREGFDADPMVRFLENLMSNPSKRAVDELYGFLEATALPITEDGCFLAYKKVRDDYRDFYTGKMDNSIGQVLEMVRNQVDDERDRTCSYGLHFCSLSYLPHYHGSQGHVMIVKINPADVVSIPSDYNNAKGRACRYEVIGEHTSETTEAFSSPVWRDYRDPDIDTGVDDDDLDSDDLDDDSDYEDGYASGVAAAEQHSEQLSAYDEEPELGGSEDFNIGYRAGYTNSYYVNWYDVAYEQAQRDVHDNRSYTDNAPDACDSNTLYVEGYADGWRDAKVNRL